MQVFLSWSGASSKALATLLKEWLPSVVQSLEPWMSSEDIEKGEAWFQSISESLVRSEGMGIFCLTPENLGAQWLAYEAGALASQDRGRVATLMLNVGASDVRPPLGLFQGTDARDKEDLFKLLVTLNSRTEKALSDDRLRKAFETYWPEFEQGLKEIDRMGGQAKQKAPDVSQLLDEILKVVRRIERDAIPQQSQPASSAALAAHWRNTHPGGVVGGLLGPSPFEGTLPAASTAAVLGIGRGLRLPPRPDQNETQVAAPGEKKDGIGPIDGVPKP